MIGVSWWIFVTRAQDRNSFECKLAMPQPVGRRQPPASAKVGGSQRLLRQAQPDWSTQLRWAREQLTCGEKPQRPWSSHPIPVVAAWSRAASANPGGRGSTVAGPARRNQPALGRASSAKPAPQRRPGLAKQRLTTAPPRRRVCIDDQRLPEAWRRNTMSIATQVLRGCGHWLNGGAVTEAELRNSLRGHAVLGGFVAWLESGFPRSRFAEYDAAGVGALDTNQLEAAVQGYIAHLQSHPSSSPASAPPRRQLKPVIKEDQVNGSDKDELAWLQTRKDAEAAEELAKRLGQDSGTCSDHLAAQKAANMSKLLRKVDSQPRPVVAASVTALRTPVLGETLWGPRSSNHSEHDSSLSGTVERVFQMLLACERVAGGEQHPDRVTVLGLSAGFRELGFQMDQQEVKEMIWAIDERLQTDPFLYMSRK